MYRLPLLFILLFPATCFSQKRIILTWDFFKNDRPANAEFQAFLSYNIKYGGRMRPGKGNLMEVQLEVKSSVDTARSYFNFDLKNKDDSLLKHEQGHADITVLHALQLTKRFSETIFYKNNYQLIIKQIYDEVIVQMNNQQVQYDEETNHGMNNPMQAKWDSLFTKELNIQ